MGPPITIKSRIICLKARERHACSRFFHRFSTPFALLIWFFVAYTKSIDANAIAFLFLVGTCAVAYNTSVFCNEMYAYMQVTHDHYKCQHIILYGAEFVTNALCIIVSFWWVGDIYKLSYVEKRNQFYIWFCVFTLALVFHFTIDRIMWSKIQDVTRSAYQHVSTNL